MAKLCWDKDRRRFRLEKDWDTKLPNPISGLPYYSSMTKTPKPIKKKKPKVRYWRSSNRPKHMTKKERRRWTSTKHQGLVGG